MARIEADMIGRTPSINGTVNRALVLHTTAGTIEITLLPEQARTLARVLTDAFGPGEDMDALMTRLARGARD